MDYRTQLRQGMTVRSADGEKLGKVVAISDRDLTIEKGFFFPKDYLCNLSDIQDIRGDEVHLKLLASSLTKGEARAPEATAGTRAAVASASEQTRIPLAEEVLTAEKRTREAGSVQVRKDVVTEQKEISVPVTREEVHVERVPAGGEMRAGEGTFRETVARIPLQEEEVEIKKRPVVREEVVITKDRYTEERRASEEVRKETAEVESKGDVAAYDEPKNR